ncbi:MAG: hypothetical protein QM426_07120 [Euryarchaeota archaeon]|nr:hypothetical protein [Euryarchaeota archaeon]
MFAGFNEDSRIVWFKISYSKGPGSLSVISDFLEKENAFIKFGHIDNITQETGEYSIFTELKKDTDLDELAGKIKELEIVSAVEHGVSEFGMIYSVDFPQNVIGVRGVMSRALTIVDIIKTLNQSVPHAEGLLTLSGLRGGVDAAKYFKSVMPINNSNFASMIAELFRAVGWGILEIDCSPETYEGKIIVKDSFIADVYGRSEQPVCAFMSGYFAGYLTEYFGKNISVREVSCKATGKDVCEYIISLAPSSAVKEYQLRGEIK